MPIVRGGYGYDLYSSSDYGTEGVVHTGSAATSVSSSFSGDGYVTTLSGTVSGSASSSTASSANATFASGALVSSTASATSVAEQFVLKESDKFAYGSSAYGYNVYDSADLQTIVSATSVASTATGGLIKSSSASVSSGSSISADSERVREQSSSIDGFSSGTGRGVFITNGSGSVSSSSTIQVIYYRRRDASSEQSVTSVVSAIGREKWEQIAYNTVNWSDIAA